jgi:hypothetical protein
MATLQLALIVVRYTAGALDGAGTLTSSSTRSCGMVCKAIQIAMVAMEIATIAAITIKGGLLSDCGSSGYGSNRRETQ